MNLKKKTVTSYLSNFAVIAALFAVLMILTETGMVTTYIRGIFIMICINIVLAVSLNLTTGTLGQIALGHAGFMSVGAYTAALFTKTKIIPGEGGFLIGLLLAGLCAAVIGLIIGIPALRLRGDYLAIITLGFGEIIRVIIENLKFTGGAQGLTGIPKLSIFPVVFWVMVISVTIMTTLVRSRHGRAILAIREDDIASEASGVNNTYYRTLAFTVSAFFAGIAGGMYANYIGVLGAKTFDFNKSIEILVIVVLGGLGSFTGSIFAATLLTILPEALRGFSDYRMLVYALLLIIMMIFKPSGLLGTYELSLFKDIRRVISKIGKKSVKLPQDGGNT